MNGEHVNGNLTLGENIAGLAILPPAHSTRAAAASTACRCRGRGELPGVLVDSELPGSILLSSMLTRCLLRGGCNVTGHAYDACRRPTDVARH